MPTRAAAAAAAAANMRTTRSRKVLTQPPQPQPPQGKENNNAASLLPPASSSASTKGKEKAVAPKKAARNVKAKKVEAEAETEVFCSCRGVDDGTPMVQCGTCDEWSAHRSSPPFPFFPPFLPPNARLNGTDVYLGIISCVSSSAKTMRAR